MLDGSCGGVVVVGRKVGVVQKATLTTYPWSRGKPGAGPRTPGNLHGPSREVAAYRLLESVSEPNRTERGRLQNRKVLTKPGVILEAERGFLESRMLLTGHVRFGGGGGGNVP